MELTPNFAYLYDIHSSIITRLKRVKRNYDTYYVIRSELEKMLWVRDTRDSLDPYIPIELIAMEQRAKIHILSILDPPTD